jgi:hypothetical protein
MSVEDWQHFFEFWGIALLFLTFVSGTGVLLTGRKVNQQQAERLRGFELQITDARTALATQQQRAATAERDLVALRLTLESERAKTLQLQRAAVQRIIRVVGHGGWNNYDVLKPYAGMTAIVVYSDHREPALFSGSMRAAMENAGWVLQPDKGPAKEEFPDGVQVGAQAVAAGLTSSSGAAATVLAHFFISCGIGGVQEFRDSTIAPNTVVVRIGQMPDPSPLLK